MIQKIITIQRCDSHKPGSGRVFVKFALLLLVMMMTGCGSPSSNNESKADPDKALDNYVELGLSYLKAGNREQARFNLLKAVEIDSASPSANNALALLYQVEGENALAEKHFKWALRRDESFSQARNNLARFYLVTGRLKEARAQYQKVSEDTNYRLRPQSFLGLALAERALGNLDKAEAALQRSLQLNPSMSTSLIELVDLKYDNSELLDAKELLDRYEQTAQASPRSLSLGVKLAEEFGDDAARDSYILALQSLFPDSREARQLKLDQRGKPAENKN